MAFAQPRFRRAWHDGDVEVALIVAGVAALFAIALTRGPVLPIVAMLGALSVGTAIAKPKAGLYLLLVVTILGDLRLTNINTSELLPMYKSFQGTGITPLEILLMATALGILIRVVFDDEFSGEAGELMLPIVALMLAIGLGAGIGAARGADLDIMRLEIRGFAYIPLVYFIVIHTVRSRSELSRMLWVFVALTQIMAIEAIARYFTHIRTGYRLDAPPSLAFAHEDAVFCAAAIIILLARVTWSARLANEWKSVALMALPMAALLVMKRRAGIVALDGGLILLSLILLRDNFRLFLMTVPLTLVFAGLLLAVTWNEPGGSGQFARSFRTISGQESTTARDQSSDDYRKIELANVRLNIANDPVTGIGFGNPYAFYIPLVDLSANWELYPYVPHNTVMWVWMKAGILAFIALLSLFAAALMRSTQLAIALKPGELKAAAFAFGAIVLMFLLFSWVDLGLVSVRSLTVFGLALGGIVAVNSIARSDQSEAFLPGA